MIIAVGIATAVYLAYAPVLTRYTMLLPYKDTKMVLLPYDGLPFVVTLIIFPSPLVSLFLFLFISITHS